MPQTDSETLLKSLQSEHDELLEGIKDIEQFWTEVNELGKGPKYEEMASRVHQLRQRLKRHFAEEERGGYLAPVVAAVPQLGSEAAELKQQHQVFLNALDRFSQHLENRDSAFHNWDEVHAEVEEFLRELHEHESAEMELVQKGLRLNFFANDFQE